MLHKKRKLGEDTWDSEKVAQFLNIDVQIVEDNKNRVNALHIWLDQIIPKMEEKKNKKFALWLFITTAVNMLRPEPSPQVMKLLKEGLVFELKNVPKGGATPFTIEEDTTLLLLMSKAMDRGLVNKTRVLEHADLFPGRSLTSLTRRFNSLLSHFFETTPVGRIHANNADPMGYLQPTIMKYIRTTETLKAEHERISEIYNQIYLEAHQNPSLPLAVSSEPPNPVNEESEELKAKIAFMVEESKDLKDKLSAVSEESEGLRADLDFFRNGYEVLKMEIADCEMAKSQLALTTAECEHLKADKQSQAERMSNEIETLSGTCERLEERIRIMSDEKDALSNRLSGIERDQGGIAKLKSLYEIKCAEHATAVSKFMNSDRKVVSLEHNLNKAREEIGTFESERQKFASQTAFAIAKIQRLEEENTVLSDRLKIMETGSRIPTFGDIQKMCSKEGDEARKKREEKKKKREEEMRHVEELEQDKITWGQERVVFQSMIDMMKEQLQAVNREYDLLAKRHETTLCEFEADKMMMSETTKVQDKLEFVESENLRLVEKSNQSQQLCQAAELANAALRDEVARLRNQLAQQQRSMNAYPSLNHGALPPINVSPHAYAYTPGTYYRR